MGVLNDGFVRLCETCRRLRFEPHDIAAQLDARGRYVVPLDEEFPLAIKLFRYTSRRHTRGGTWHERLELFLPLDGPARFRMGEQEVGLDRGDLLVVDNLKLHHVVDFPGFDTRVIVVSFLPEFVYSLGSPSHDYAFLLPFYSKLEKKPHAMRAGDKAAADVHGAMTRLLDCYFGGTEKPFFQAGSKAFLLELLYHLAAHFRASAVAKWEFMRQQERSLRLKRLFDHINACPAGKLPVSAAARLAGMSAPQFMRTFKQVAGMTLVAYLNHVRLSNGARLLRETDKSIAEIASEVGFSDQSYFDRRFKRAFGQVPKEFRRRAVRPSGSG
ncbi:MAG: helix-turn-helix transcriptional regulator [Verrucomicrobiae bacterium]|nr:helix-turn-helix transcriptional regulator [Verrucomicrobiae bacterium]